VKNEDKKVAVVIANWNGKALLEDCLNSLKQQTYKKFEIIIIDNGSTDGSVDYLVRNWPKIKLIVLEKNTGFAYANNLGIQEAFKNPNIKYVITLNNDTKADSFYIEKMVEFADNYPEAGSIQPKVINFFEKDKIDSTGILIYFDCSAINRGQKSIDVASNKTEEIFGASASAALYNRKALEETKLSEGEFFDNDYFAYYEDVDLAWRLRLAGFKSFFIPEAKVFHVHSATGKMYSPFKAFHIHRNQYFNIIKNLPFGMMWKALFFMPIRYLLLLSSVLMKKGPSSKLNENTKGKGDGIFLIVLKSWKEVAVNLPKMIKKRRQIQKTREVNNAEIKNWFKKYSAKMEDMIYR